MPGFQVIYGDYEYNITKNSQIASGNYLHKYTFYLDGSLTNVGLKDCSLPTFSVTKGQILGGSIEYKYAKSVVFDDVNVSYYDTNRHLSYWKARVESIWKDGELKPVNDYKQDKNVIVQYLPTEFKDVSDPERRYNLYNVWPSTVKYGDLSYTDSEVNLMQITLTYDWMDIESTID